MKFLLSGEIFANTGIDKFNISYIQKFIDYFKDREYSAQLKEIFLVFICRPGGPYRQRRRYDAKEGVFYLDIMMDFRFVMEVSPDDKRRYYFECFEQLYPILETYKKKIKDLKLEQFKYDLDALITQLKKDNVAT